MKYGRIAAQTGAAPSNGKISLINDQTQNHQINGLSYRYTGRGIPYVR